MSSPLLDRVLGPDLLDHDEPTCDRWYRTVETYEDLATCRRQHEAAMAARFHGRPLDGRRARRAPVDPDRERETRPLPLTDRQTGLLALGLLWALAILLGGFLLGHTMAMVLSGVAVAVFVRIAAGSAARALAIWRHGPEVIR